MMCSCGWEGTVEHLVLKKAGIMERFCGYHYKKHLLGCPRCNSSFMNEELIERKLSGKYFKMFGKEICLCGETLKKIHEEIKICPDCRKIYCDGWKWG